MRRKNDNYTALEAAEAIRKALNRSSKRRGWKQARWALLFAMLLSETFNEEEVAKVRVALGMK